VGFGQPFGMTKSGSIDLNDTMPVKIINNK
jgi:hypothetical protein